MADGNSEADKLKKLPIKEGQNLDAENALNQAEIFENERYREDTETRKKLSLWAKKVVTYYLIYVGVFLLLNFSPFRLSDFVLITLLGTTTLNVLGLMYIVLKGYFAAKL